MERISKNWIDFKELLDSNILFIEQVVEGFYELYAQDGVILYHCQVSLSDTSDYETNYQDRKSTTLNPITIDGIPTVAVNTTLSVLRYKPKFYQKTTDTSVNENQEVTLFEFTGDGQIDFISINAQTKKFEVILEVDNEEIYRINIDMLHDRHKLKDEENYIHTDSSSEFTEMYPSPIDFLNGFKIKVKNVHNNTKKVYASLIRYREKI